MKTLSSEILLITYSDLTRLLLCHRHFLKKVLFFSALITFVFLLLKTPHYTAVATFKQASERSEGGHNIKEMFQQMFTPTDGSAIVIIQSRQVLTGVVEELGMQAAVHSEYFLLKALKNAGRNCVAEMGISLSSPELFTFSDVSYLGDKPLNLFLKVTKEGTYQLFDRNRQWINEAKLGESISHSFGKLTLQSAPKGTKENQFYPLKIHPLHETIINVKKKLTIIPDKLDKNILSFSFASSERKTGVAFLNFVMWNYQKFLKKENDEIALAQVSYLHERQEELAEHFNLALLEHSSYLKENLAKNGWMGFAEENESLVGPKNLYTSQLFHVEFELQRLSGEDLLSPNITSIINSLKEKKEIRFPGNEKNDSQPDSNDFSGLSQESAKQLLSDYTRDRDQLQAQVKELFFLRDQLVRSDFEISSLGHVFSDGVTADLVQKASITALQLKDGDNRSVRELERLSETLQTQKSFLSQYLYQTIEMKKLRGKLLDEKIARLHHATLQVLRSEKELLKQKLAELNVKMGDLPGKWHRESLLEFKKELGSIMLQEVSELLETKHLGRHIFQVNSRPIDLASSLPDPAHPHIFLFTSLSVILSGVFCCFFLFCRALLKGIPLTEDHLRSTGLPVSGSLSLSCTTQLSQIKKSDLETLRRLVGFLSSWKKTQEALCFNCIGGKYLDYSLPLAELLAMRGLKVLVIHCAFDCMVPLDVKPGLFHYLHNEIQDLPIYRHRTYDYLPSGLTSEYGAELLSTPKFETLLTSLKSKYQAILIYSSADAAKSEGQALLPLVDAAIISVAQEKKEDLRVYCEWSLKKQAECVTFVYTHHS